MTAENPNYAAIVDRACTRKKHYTSKRVALRVARRIRQQTGDDVRHYKCPVCGVHTVGHKATTQAVAQVQAAAEWARNPNGTRHA